MYLLVLSADEFINSRASSGSKLFETDAFFTKENFEKINVERYLQTTKNHEKYPAFNELELTVHHIF